MGQYLFDFYEWYIFTPLMHITKLVGFASVSWSLLRTNNLSQGNPLYVKKNYFSSKTIISVTKNTSIIKCID